MNTKPRDVIFAIKPCWAEKIRSGEKTLEIRKVIPRELEKGSPVYFYETAPVGKITAACTVIAIYYKEKKKLLEMNRYLNGSKDEAKIEKYLEGCEGGFGILLGKVIPCRTPLSLAVFGVTTPPQNFCYVPENKGEEK